MKGLTTGFVTPDDETLYGRYIFVKQGSDIVPFPLRSDGKVHVYNDKVTQFVAFHDYYTVSESSPSHDHLTASRSGDIRLTHFNVYATTGGWDNMRLAVDDGDYHYNIHEEILSSAKQNLTLGLNIILTPDDSIKVYWERSGTTNYIKFSYFGEYI